MRAGSRRRRPARLLRRPALERRLSRELLLRGTQSGGRREPPPLPHQRGRQWLGRSQDLQVGRPLHGVFRVPARGPAAGDAGALHRPRLGKRAAYLPSRASHRHRGRGDRSGHPTRCPAILRLPGRRTRLHRGRPAVCGAHRQQVRPRGPGRLQHRDSSGASLYARVLRERGAGARSGWRVRDQCGRYALRPRGARCMRH